MRDIIFLIIIFIVSFMSDLILRILSPKYIPSLVPYFNSNSVILAGIYAGLTIVIATILMLFIYKLKLPTSRNDIIIFFIIAFIVGYIIDIIIMKYNIFGDSLKQFYDTYGAGFWGALSFIFALGVTFLIKSTISL